MNTQTLIVVAVAAIAAALLAWWFVQSRRRDHLRTRFGPEYERAIRETGNVSKAETMLADRERLQFGGTFHVLRPGMAEFQVKDIRLRDFSVPAATIPRLLRQIWRGTRPEGLSPDGLPVVIPAYLGDVRITNETITIHKAGSSGG